MLKHFYQHVRCVTLALILLSRISAHAAETPNVVLIYTDDQGYGDVSALNPESKFQTPNLDRLVKEGMTFTDGHCSDTVCTPSRYGLLTGRYSWRTTMKNGVMGSEGPCLIENGRVTVASLLRDNGYDTAIVGKWHLGMVFDGKMGQRDWTKPFTDGPIEKGFDYFWGIPASMNFGILTYLENDRPLQPATLWTFKKSGLLKHDPSSYRMRPPFDVNRPTTGNKKKTSVEVAADFNDVDVLGKITSKAIEWIEAKVNDDRQKPFFVYVPMTSPHKPVIPTPEFRGKSDCGAYGDFMIETDHRVGQILDTLDRLNVADNTMVVFTSDNGPENTYIKRKDVFQHHSAIHYRGGKRDLYEGGHRVPFLVRWPNGVQAASTCDTPVCQTDLLATLADMLDVKLPMKAGEDSVSFLPALQGKQLSGRPLMHHSGSGHFAIRDGRWKLILPGRKNKAMQLYDLQADPGETKNIARQNSDEVKRLTNLATETVRRSSQDWWTQLTWIPE